MDEGPHDQSRRQEDEEWAQLQREANAIDPERYRKRRRALAAVGVGALGAGLVWAALTLTDSARNPCQRVRDHLCREDPRSAACTSYEAIVQESVEHPSGEMRSLVRDQCLTRIKRLEADGVRVR